MRLIFLLLLSVAYLLAGKTSFASVSKVLARAIATESQPTQINGSGSSVYWTNYVPIESAEYQYSAQKFGEDQTHTVRINFKSPSEMFNTTKATEVALELQSVSQKESFQIVRQLTYMSVIDGIYQRMEARFRRQVKSRNDRLLKVASDLLKVKNSSAKQIIDQLSLSTELSMESSVTSEVPGRLQDLPEVEVASGYNELIGMTNDLTLKVLSFIKTRPSSIQAERRSLSLQLDSIESKMKEADKQKILSYLDLRENTPKGEQIFRVGFNIPFSRFDQLREWREEQRLQINQLSLELANRKERAEVSQALRRLSELNDKVRSLRQQTDQLNQLLQSLVSSNDTALLTHIQDEETKRQTDLLLVGRKFYETYFECLSLVGLIGSSPRVNFLNKNWQDLESL